MLQNGAVKVYSIDVGYGQLDWKLRNDPRVVCMEKTNIRYVVPEDLGEPADFSSIDVSFICLLYTSSGRDEQSCLVSLAGILMVLFWIVPYIYELFESIQQLFVQMCIRDRTRTGCATGLPHWKRI